MDFSSLEPVPYDVSSPTTAGLYRGHGRFVKVLRSYRDWEVLPLLPDEFRSLALDTDLWRYEADVYLDGLASSLPAGLRLPTLYDVQEPDPDHVILVLEDVETTDSPWDHDRYGDAAELLGRLNARLTKNDALPAPVDRTPERLTRAMVDGLVRPLILPPLLDEATWTHPLLAGADDVRRGLIDLAAYIPTLLDELADRPQVLSHGDACPQNLLLQGKSIVAVDWSPSGMVAAGDDLGQLLIGRAHQGTLGVEEFAVLRELVIDRYHAGLVAEGFGSVAADDVRAGLDGSLLLRSALLSLPVGRLAEPVTPELADLFQQRLELTQYLVRLGAATVTW
ncbi:phosphotransferase [Kribbella sp. NPDC026596]|uniref:phosphotransferase n=1 Tax=Kribbella sp. NPDC026596 TaxID=3155122 RepID=UPI0033F16DF3